MLDADEWGTVFWKSSTRIHNSTTTIVLAHMARWQILESHCWQTQLLVTSPKRLCFHQGLLDFTGVLWVLCLTYFKECHLQPGWFVFLSRFRVYYLSVCCFFSIASWLFLSDSIHFHFIHYFLFPVFVLSGCYPLAYLFLTVCCSVLYSFIISLLRFIVLFGCLIFYCPLVILLDYSGALLFLHFCSVRVLDLFLCSSLYSFSYCICFPMNFYLHSQH